MQLARHTRPLELRAPPTPALHSQDPTPGTAALLRSNRANPNIPATPPQASLPAWRHLLVTHPGSATRNSSRARFPWQTMPPAHASTWASQEEVGTTQQARSSEWEQWFSRHQNLLGGFSKLPCWGQPPEGWTQEAGGGLGINAPPMETNGLKKQKPKLRFKVISSLNNTDERRDIPPPAPMVISHSGSPQDQCRSRTGL